MPKIRFRKLGLLYIIALSGIALSLVISQLVVQQFISHQQNDSRIINIAGRQRMLSQKIAGLSLKLERDPLDNVSRTDLGNTLDEWEKAHHALQEGDSTMKLTGENSQEILTLFGNVQPYFRNMLAAGRNIVADEKGTRDFDVIHHSEEIFLKGMDRIVNQYEEEALHKVFILHRTEYIILAIGLGIILLELLFIFRPLARNIRATVIELVHSEEEMASVNRQLSKVYEELSRSYQDLEAVRIKPEKYTRMATLDAEGNFLDISDTFHKVLQYDSINFPSSLPELLFANSYKEYFISGLIHILIEGRKWSGELKLSNADGDFCWFDFYIIPIEKEGHFKLFGRDKTNLKEAELKSQELNREKIDQKVREMNYRSSLILEGQEEERKRLSRELHDGVGQMLSALKLSLESVIPPSSAHMKKRLNDSKSLLKGIIQEVRRVSFNLTPSSLDDFGLVPAVKKFCEEINSVTKTIITFHNETRFINRLSSSVETNLYRIVQEAVNNALKYASATEINVTFYHSPGKLTIGVRDNGKGFDMDRLEVSGHLEKAGHGLFNMRERAAFIEARFELQSKIGEGTNIRIIVSLD